MKRFYCPRHWTAAQRLAHYTDKTGGHSACWPWVGRRNRQGYGELRFAGQMRKVPPLLYRTLIGPIPNGKRVRHRCWNNWCANPEHLFLGTFQEIARAREAMGRGGGKKRAGERHNFARLTEAKVHRIRRDTRPTRLVAAAFGISVKHLRNIRRRVSWRHLPDEVRA